MVTAGSYASPAILMRSGIGPAGALRDLGIGVAADLPGVGDNLIDHPLAAVDLPTTPGFAGPRFQVMLTLRSALAGPGGPPDLHLSPPGRSTTPRARQAGYSASSPGCWRSAPGAVRLRSAGPADPPRIDIAHLRHPEDMTRMIEATRRARRLSRTPPLAGFATGAGLAPGPAISDGDTAGLARSIRERAGSYHHPVGNLRDGPPPGDGAVVDARGRVHGIDRLWVADASVMPAIPAANTNLTAIGSPNASRKGYPPHDQASSGLSRSAMSLQRAVRKPEPPALAPPPGLPLRHSSRAVRFDGPARARLARPARAVEYGGLTSRHPQKGDVLCTTVCPP